MCWFWTAIFISFTLFINNLSDARHHPEKSSSSAAVVVGTVNCDTCFRQDIPNANRFIEGATVAVECKSTATTPHFRQEVTANNLGQFRIQLPFHVSKHLKTIDGCSVTLLRSNHPFCAAAAEATPSPLHLKSTTQHKQIFSAGFFTFKPQVCNNVADLKQKPSPRMAFLLPPNPLLPPPTLIPPILPSPPPSLIPPVFPTPPASVIPPILPTPPTLPTPSLPLPPIPGMPSLPVPPIPGLPSPSLPTPSLPVPPIPGVPSLPLPLIPGLVPSPPPPPPSFPLPLPPVPFLPPLIPGGPPAEVSSPARNCQP